MNVIVLDACKIELVEKCERVLEVDVVIGDTVHKKETLVAAEGCGIGDHGQVVAVGVLLGGAHVAFCVDTVVEAPVGYRGNGHAIAESAAGVLLKCLEGGETAVGPAPDSKAIGIDIKARCEVFGSSDVEACASGIDGDDQVAKRGGNISLEVYTEPLGDRLRTWAGVLLEEDGIFLLGVEVRWASLYVVDFNAITKVKSAIFVNGKLMSTSALCKLSVILDDMLIDLKPATVNLINVDGVDSLALARTNIDQDHLENITDTVCLFNESFVSSPKEVVDDTIIIREGTVVVDREDILLCNVVEKICLLTLFRVCTTGALDEELNGEFRNTGFVGAKEGQILAIFRPPCSATTAEDLFFVYPVRNTVEVFGTTIFGDLDNILRIVYTLAGNERFGLLCLDVKNEVDGAERVTPILLFADTEQDLLQVGTGFVPIRCKLVSLVNKEVILHQCTRLGSLVLVDWCPGILLVVANVFYNDIGLLASSNLKQQTVLTIRTSDPADAVCLGSPGSVKELVHCDGFS
ncbi:hypothetical protein HG530_005330 [Fusarium avenaceum]|nr:hypothetical protein HG530_005330 [Fusarium avenaceum]